MVSANVQNIVQRARSVEVEGHPVQPRERKRDCVRSVHGVRPVCREWHEVCKHDCILC